MIVFDIFINEIFQMSLSKDEHSIQAFTFDAPDKSLNDTVQMRGHGKGSYRFHSRIPQDAPELLGEEWVSVMDEIFLVLQEATEGVCEVFSHLPHPHPIRLSRNTYNADFSSRIVDADENIIAGQSCPCIDFSSEEINGSQRFPMGSQKFRPSGLSASVRAGVVTISYEYKIGRAHV